MSETEQPQFSFILVLGTAGSGRSTFIRGFLKETDPTPTIGQDIQPETERISEYSVTLEEETVVLVDTPGNDFSDDILQDIEDWMSTRAISFSRIRGLVFLQPITANRVDMSINKRVLEKLLGTGKGQIYRHVVLCTSMWPHQVSEDLEATYKKRGEIIQRGVWGPLEKRGAMMQSYDGTSDSARRVIRSILEAPPPDEGKRSGLQVRDAPLDVSSGPVSPPQNGVPTITRFAWSFRSIFKSYRGKFIILLLGPSGTGKSKFIANATKRNVKIGEGLTPCTNAIRTYQTTLPTGREVVLVDTPGYDMSRDSPNYNGVLRLVSGWLRNRNDSWNCFSTGNVTISSILFFYRMSDNRVPKSTQKHSHTFKQAGNTNDSFSRVHLVTSLWNEVAAKDGQQLEDKLKSQLWKEFVDEGSSVHRFNPRDSASAVTILEAVIGNKEVGDIFIPSAHLTSPTRDSQNPVQ